MTSKAQHGLPALPVISDLISICCSSFFLLCTPGTLASCCSSNRLVTLLFQEGGPLSGPESGLSSNTQKLIVWGDTWADKATGFIGKGTPGREQWGKGTQENCSATWLPVSGFMVMGLVPRLSLANHSDSGSFLVGHALLSQDGCQQEGFWEVEGHMVLPFDLYRTLPIGGGLLVPCSLLGPPVIK